MDLEEGGHVEGVDLVDELGDLGVGEAFGDQEDGVGVEGAGLGDLVGVDDEILADDGEIDGLLDLLDEGGAASEVFLVCEAGDRRCACIGVPLRYEFRTESILFVE